MNFFIYKKPETRKKEVRFIEFQKMTNSISLKNQKWKKTQKSQKKQNKTKKK
jgi:hypothetical protein